MHSLLFAALETFSLILLRKKNIRKGKQVITFSDYLKPDYQISDEFSPSMRSACLSRPSVL